MAQGIYVSLIFYTLTRKSEITLEELLRHIIQSHLTKGYFNKLFMSLLYVHRHLLLIDITLARMHNIFRYMDMCIIIVIQIIIKLDIILHNVLQNIFENKNSKRMATSIKYSMQYK